MTSSARLTLDCKTGMAAPLVIGSIHLFGALVLTRNGTIETPSLKWQHKPMDYDEDKVDEMVLALFFLTLHGDGRAWKGHDWDAMGRLHKKGMICDPVGKAKSVVLTEEGEKRCEELFRKHFCGPHWGMRSAAAPT